MELEKSPEWLKCQHELKKLLKDNIVDFILFGSLVKGGRPRDIDIAVIMNGEVDIHFKKEIQDVLGKPVDVQFLEAKSIYSPLWLTLIKEGYSIAKGKYLFELYGITPQVLYKYSLTALNRVQKVQFERGVKKVLRKEGKYITRAVALVPIHIKNRMRDFLKQWKVYYECQEYELLPVMRKEEV